MTCGAYRSAVAHLICWRLSQTWLNAIAGTLNSVASMAAATVPE